MWVPTNLNQSLSALGGNWKAALIASGTAAVLSLLMSLSATGIGNPSSASFVTVAAVGKHEKRSA